MQNEDDILIQQFKNGDDSAFTKLYDKYFPLALNFFQKDPLTVNSAEDLAQDIFIKLARAISVNEIFSFKSLFYKAMFNKKKDLIRRKYRRNFPILSLFQEISSSSTKGGKESVLLDTIQETETLNPDEATQLKELEKIVRNCVDKFKNMKRRTIVALKLEGLKEVQIAEIMSINPHTVSSNWGRAKLLLRDCIQKNFNLPLY